MGNRDTSKQLEPWYRVGMVWLMITLPLIAVVASLVTVGIAMKNAPKIVEKNTSTLTK